MVELVGEHEFAAPQELVWEMVMDPEVLAMTISGCEKLERIDENTLQGLLNLRVGPVQGIFQGKVESTDVHPPRSLHMIISGSGPAGVVRGEGNITLEALPAATRLRYDGAVQVSGRIASVGQRVMDSSARSIVRQCLQNLERQIEARLEPAPELEPGPGTVEDVPAVAPVAPSQTEFALNVARDVIGDLVSQPRERSMVIGLGLAVAIVGFLHLFANLVARRVVKILREA